MNGFFTNLVDRHLGTCDTIQPRSRGRFETDSISVAAAYSAEGTGPDLTEHEQTPQTSAEFSIDESPTLTSHKPGPIENKNDFSSHSSSDQKTPPSKSTVTEEHAAHFGAHVLPIKSQRTQSADIDIQPNRGTVKPDQPDKVSMVDDKNTIINKYLNSNVNKLDEVMRGNNLPPTSSTGEHLLENELNHRIHAMLKRLTDNPSSPATSPDQNERSNQSNETLLSILPETETPLSNSANASLESSPASNRQATQEENRFSENQDIVERHRQLEPPLWLSDMASQLTQRLREKETKTEPVINVTIGRVEIRAVQTEKPKSVAHTKKPTGVMTLDNYLKRREGGGTK